MKLFKYPVIIIIFIFLLIVPISAQDATETPDDTDTMAEVTEVPQFESQAYIRFGHFIPDALAVDVYLNDEPVAENITYTDISAWMVVPAGSHSLAVVAHADSMDNAIYSVSFNVRQDYWMTIALLATGDAINVSLIQQAMYTEFPGTAQATFANVLSSGESISIGRNDVTFVAGLPVTTGNTIVQNSIPVDSEDFIYTLLDGAGNLMAEGIEIDTEDTSSYLIVATGTADDPQLIINETENWEMRLLNGEIEAPATLLEVAQVEPLLAPFLIAMESAGMLDILSGEETVTIFAPVDYVMDDVDLANGNLATILRYHIVEGDYKSGDLFIDVPELTTLDGDTLSITQTEQGFVNGVQIIVVNLVGSNGTIHIVNNLLTGDQ